MRLTWVVPQELLLSQIRDKGFFVVVRKEEQIMLLTKRWRSGTEA